MHSIDAISKTSIKLLLSEPFYGHFMMGLPREVSPKTETLALALMDRQPLKLIINEAFWNSLNEDHQYGLIKHEMLHILLKHLFMIKNYPNKALFKIAADLVVNQYIDQKQLPEGSILLEQFAYLTPMYNIRLEPGKDLPYYYHQLDKVFKKEALMSFGKAVDASNNQGELQVRMESLFDENNLELGRHQHWESVGQLSEGERKVAEYQVNRMIKQTADRVNHKFKNYGNLPHDLAIKLAKTLEKIQPRLNWRRLLRLFARSSNSTFIKNTIRRPSKRYGSVPGIKVKRRNRLLLAIDTSGSIRQHELQDFFVEVHAIWRQGSEIRIVECDTVIRKTYDYKGISPLNIHGRGETSFEAPIEYGNEIYRPDALIYFTDGFATVPKTLARFPILWTISSDGLKEGEGIWNELQGKKIKIFY